MSTGRLTKEEIAEIAHEYVDRELPYTEAQAKPKALMLAGQSGAGKSTLSADLGEALEKSGGYIRVDPDILRTRLPYAGDYSAEEVNRAPETQADAREVARAVRDLAIANKRNVVMDTTLRDPEQAIGTALSLREAGYRVELHAMAVNEQISFERASMRYESERSDGQYARFVPRDWHDRSYHGMADSVRALEYRALVDEIHVYNRLGDPIHTQVPEHGKATAAQTLIRAREQLTGYEKINLAERWDDISESMEKRNASTAEWQAVAIARERAHYTLRSDAQAAEQYDYDHPEQRHESERLAQSYGQRLESAYRDKALDQAREMPELTRAFAAEAAVRRLAVGSDNPQVQKELGDAMEVRIARSLRTGEPLRDVNVREGITTVATRDHAIDLEP